jgi:uncharacterized membrane protein YwzB
MLSIVVFLGVSGALSTGESPGITPDLYIELLVVAMAVAAAYIGIQAGMFRYYDYDPYLFATSLSVVPTDQFVKKSHLVRIVLSSSVIAVVLGGVYATDVSSVLLDQSTLAFSLGFYAALFVMDLHSLSQLRNLPSKARVYSEHTDAGLQNHLYVPQEHPP